MRCANILNGKRNKTSTFSHGEEHPNWHGGQFYQRGYLYVMVNSDSPLFPMANKYGYAKRHRIVMAEHLGRCLNRSEHVHHINGVTDDDRLENLQLLSCSEHRKLHVTSAPTVAME